MYQLGALGQQGTTKIIRSQRGERPNCPSGWQVMGRHGSGIRESVECYLPQTFAPPPTTTVTYHAPRTTVSVPTAVTTAISPQISPTLAQQQASPGAAVTAQPVSAPAPVTGAATVPTGITEAQLRDILSAQAAAVEAERAAEERKREVELETMRREIAARERATQEIDLARRKAEADRIEADRFARETAEADAIASAAAIPPPPSMTYAPTGGGGFPAMPPAAMLPPPDMTMAPEARDVTITQDGEPVPWALIAIAAAGIGAVVLVGGKRAKRKRGKK